MKNFLFKLFGILAVVCVYILLPQNGHTENKIESAYQRITRTNTIKCGFTTWDPLFFIDSKTGEKRGIFHDLMEEAGKRLDLKIVWQEELGWGSIVEAVRSRRVDMACAGYWLNPPRIKNLQFSIPQLYSPIYIYMRANETSIPKSPEELNNPRYTVSTIDGSADSQIIARDFSHAKNITLPELNSSSDTIQNLVAKKADFLLLDSATAQRYEENNPGQIKNVFPDKTVILFPTIMLLPPEEPGFNEMMDGILMNIEEDGTLDAILKKYNSQSIFLRNPQPTRLVR